MKAFIVNSKDLFNKNKNPNLSLSVKDILKNSKIKKTEVKNENNKKSKSQEYEKLLRKRYS